MCLIAVGTFLFYFCIAIYLYGDLAIYGASVGKSLRDVCCTYFPPDAPCNETLSGDVACWEGADLSRDNAYRLFLVTFFFIEKIFFFLQNFHIFGSYRRVFLLSSSARLASLTSRRRWSYKFSPPSFGGPPSFL